MDVKTLLVYVKRQRSILYTTRSRCIGSETSFSIVCCRSAPMTNASLDRCSSQ